MNNTIDTVRFITDHAIDPDTEKLSITASDAPGAGGASHLYEIAGFDNIMDDASNPRKERSGIYLSISFQNGPIPEVGINGITNEALLAIVADRLRGFQSGPYACHENFTALYHVEAALNWLKYRTRDRISRGVEGTYKA